MSQGPIEPTNQTEDFPGIPNSFQVSEREKRYLLSYAPEVRMFEVLFLRYAFKKNLKGMDKLARKDAFRHGWNSHVFVGDDEYILTKEQAAELRHVRDAIAEAEKKDESGA